MEYKQDAATIKENIVRFIQSNGPCLPIHVSKGVNLSMLFTSAFLSELFSDQAVKMTNMRVGSSAIYFIVGQEPMLEKFSQHLKSREKDAFLMLKENHFLKDSEQEPAIRVALRMIKDFAVPFEKNNELFWKYYLADEKEIFENKNPEAEVILEKPTQELEIEKEELIEEETKEIPKKEKTIKKEKPKQENKIKKLNKNKKKDENFFNKIKEFLAKKGVEILDIKDFKNDEAVLKVKKDKKEEIMFIFNKKKITEKEILKAHKKAHEEKMQYSILSMGEAPKKLADLISAVRDLSKIEKLD